LGNWLNIGITNRENRILKKEGRVREEEAEFILKQCEFAEPM